MSRTTIRYLTTLALLVGGPRWAPAQHAVDLWVGETEDGKIALGGVQLGDPIVLTPTSGLITGWAGINPGFDHVIDASSDGRLYPLRGGSQIWLQVVGMSPGLQLIDAQFHAHDHTSGIHEHFLGDNHLHTHFTWLINSELPGFDVLQTAWQVHFTLRDSAGALQSSDPVTLTFSNIDATIGDVDGDGQLADEDIEGFWRVVADPRTASAQERAAADADLNGFVTAEDACSFLSRHGRAGFVRGDANNDSIVDMADSVYVLSYLFLGGSAPHVEASGDIDGNRTVEISDPIYLLSYLFLGGPQPPAPFPSTGCN